jgi:hypothetical protein
MMCTGGLLAQSAFQGGINAGGLGIRAHDRAGMLPRHSRSNSGLCGFFTVVPVGGIHVAAAAAILIATTAAGSAADMAVKAPYTASAPIWNWTGFYIGGHVGAGWGTTETTVDSIAAPGFR